MQDIMNVFSICNYITANNYNFSIILHFFSPCLSTLCHWLINFSAFNTSHLYFFFCTLCLCSAWLSLRFCITYSFCCSLYRAVVVTLNNILQTNIRLIFIFEMFVQVLEDIRTLFNTISSTLPTIGH